MENFASPYALNINNTAIQLRYLSLAFIKIVWIPTWSRKRNYSCMHISWPYNVHLAFGLYPQTHSNVITWVRADTLQRTILKLQFLKVPWPRRKCLLCLLTQIKQSAMNVVHRMQPVNLFPDAILRTRSSASWDTTNSMTDTTHCHISTVIYILHIYSMSKCFQTGNSNNGWRARLMFAKLECGE